MFVESTMPWVRRKSLNQSSHKQRHRALTSIEIMQIHQRKNMLRKLKRVYALSSHVTCFTTRKIIARHYHRVQLQLFYLEHYFEPPNVPRRIFWKRRTVTIEELNDVFVRNSYRFHNKAQIRRLHQLLQLKPVVRLANQQLLSSEEALLITLERLHYPCNFSDLAQKYELDPTNCGRCCNHMVYFICRAWGYLLRDNLEFWLPHFPLFCEKIKLKVEKQVGRIVSLEEDAENGFSIFGFIDNTISAICRPASGPAAPGGPNAPRQDPLIQQAFYTKFKKLHGVKFQVIALPNGMFLHVQGAISARNNDVINLRESDILNILRNLQEGSPVLYTIHGDGAYDLPHRMITGGPLVVRVTCEWEFGDLKQLFSAIDFEKMLRLRENHVSSIIFASMWFFNAHVAMNGNNTSNYFDLLPPTIEEWMAAGPSICDHPWLFPQ